MIHFARPVEVVIARSGRRARAASPRDALRLLVSSHWPEKSGAPFDSAVGFCVKAMRGSVPADLAREAFIDAARRANLLAESEGRP